MWMGLGRNDDLLVLLFPLFCNCCLVNEWLTTIHSAKFLTRRIIFITNISFTHALKYYLPVVAVSLDNRVWREMSLVVNTRALLHRYTPLTIVHCAVTTATAVKTSLRTNIISLLYLARGRARRTTFTVLQGCWARDSCMKAVSLVPSVF